MQLSAVVLGGGKPWETLCYVCHFTPHPFPRVHKKLYCLYTRFLLKGLKSGKKSRSCVQLHRYLLPAFCQIIKSKTVYVAILK